ncbi:hypothetical protein FP74_gp167 [Bacillus phage CAM003]|uniref:Uncharacterized protein n=1 Tax=Bacillus phage CAM003 TaxID=1486657 RepID=A0A024AZ93_9CAUD|nr:hypothetical protein FP74_gp167 [Bacillus phage CAM003]AHZ09629.1 hypothetical protein [Bacillus phage CAM003]
MEIKESTNDIFNLSNKNITYYKRGCLSADGEPHYIVELVKEPNNVIYAVVYDVHTPHPKGQGLQPKKKAKRVKEHMNRFSTSTLLGRIANKMVRAKYNEKWVEEPPLFVAPVVLGNSTLSGRRGAGFYEREKDELKPKAGELVMVRGENTGVFVALDDIHWFGDFSVPVESIIKAIIKEQEQKSDFYDLTGDNDDTNNPLSRYYKNLE